jgi:biopolymer transport protein ExbD
MRRRIREDEETGELNIVPYLDVVVNLVMFLLLSMTGLITLGVLNVSAPKAGGSAVVTDKQDQKDAGPKLLLTVAIAKQGFFIAEAGGLLGADAKAADMSRAPTIPLKGDGKYDFAELSRQLAAIKDRYPQEKDKDESPIILSADFDVVYDILIQTMDACRELVIRDPADPNKTERKRLFRDVSLSVIG